MMNLGESQRGGTRHFTPAWDGNPQGWRRCKEEVRIWLLAEKVEGVEYSLAARLVQRLTGAARRAAMTLSDEDLMGEDSGVPEALGDDEYQPAVKADPRAGVRRVLKRLEEALTP